MDVLVYGDSLTVNAQTANGLTLPGKLVGVRAKSGKALCDWVPGMATDRAVYHPKTVVIAPAAPCRRQSLATQVMMLPVRAITTVLGW